MVHSDSFEVFSLLNMARLACILQLDVFVYILASLARRQDMSAAGLRCDFELGQCLITTVGRGVFAACIMLKLVPRAWLHDVLRDAGEPICH